MSVRLRTTLAATAVVAVALGLAAAALLLSLHASLTRSARELAVLGSRGFVPDDIRDAIDLYLDGTLDVSHLVESVRPLEEANAALEDLKAGRVFRSVLAPA